jgi:hypothetical protein
VKEVSNSIVGELDEAGYFIAAAAHAPVAVTQPEAERAPRFGDSIEREHR